MFFAEQHQANTLFGTKQGLMQPWIRLSVGPARSTATRLIPLPTAR
jgi:hypothetical protein